MQNEADALNTPVMKQFLEIKSRYPDAILFFRMGDFYEMFLDDAIKASSILDITLTKRQNQIPMCGIPYHSADSYISRMLAAGENVVICEQKNSNDPKAKLMQREVVRVITPGTVIEDNLLTGYNNNFLCVLFFTFDEILMCFADVSTSELFYVSHNLENLNKVTTSLCKFSPREIIYPKNQKERIHFLLLAHNYKMTEIEYFPPESIEVKYSPLKEILHSYLTRNFKENPFAFKNPVVLDDSDYLGLDEQTVRNLELVENRNEESHTLFFVLNKCRTSKGKRVMRQRILFPTRNQDLIENRWDKINKVGSSKKYLHEIKSFLNDSADIERIISRFRGNKAYPRDFRAIEKNIEVAFKLSHILKEIGIHFHLPEKQLNDLRNFINERLHENDLPPVIGTGIFLKQGFNDKLDKARNIKNNNKDLILELEAAEKKKTGLHTLKIKYNKIVGYFIELSRTQGESAPSHFIKKQTLVTTERFSFPELEELEANILEADAIIQEIEQNEFTTMVLRCLEDADALSIVSEEIGELDFIISLYDCKEDYRWVKPEIHKDEIIIDDSRHPVIENFLHLGEQFIPNDIHLNNTDKSIAILTGPNMAGKSTFMRQIGIIQILFQIGSFVPAKKAKLFIADRVFTRIGSGDNLTAGESTFFIEMKESANILNNATNSSLLLFDEVGRGTSTYDGLSIAWSILEYLNSLKNKPKAIFSTHYHELTELEKEKGMFNLFLDTREKDGEVIFLKKVKPGKANKSFGLYVAKIAGIPEGVIQRAEKILHDLERRKHLNSEQLLLFQNPVSENAELVQKELDAIKIKLTEIDPDNTTPIQALGILKELKSFFS